MPNYEFFVTSGVPAPATKAVRSHAMKTALRQRSGLETGAIEMPNGSINSQHTTKLKGKLKGRFRLAARPIRTGKTANAAAVETRCAASDPKEDTTAPKRAAEANCRDACRASGMQRVEWLGADVIDPFAALPIQNNGKIDRMFKDFLAFFDYYTTTVPKGKTWLASALHDPLLMRITLCTAATFVALKVPSYDAQLRHEGWKLMGEAIEDINGLISSGHVSENVLGAIAHLAHIRYLEGFTDEADIHLLGLQRLVALRGGIASIENYQVGRFINWADLELASSLGRRPLFSLHYDVERVRLPEYVIEAANCPPLSFYMQDPSPGAETVSVVIGLLRQRVMAAKCSLDPTLRDVRTLSHSAVFLILNSIEDAPLTVQARYLNTVLLALHLFISYAMSEHFRWSTTVLQCILRRLKSSIDGGYVDSKIWETQKPVILWVLFVGAVTAGEHPLDDTAWFLPRLQFVRDIVAYRTRAQFEMSLRSMVWDEKFGASLLDSWWDDGAVFDADTSPNFLP